MERIYVKYQQLDSHNSYSKPKEEHVKAPYDQANLVTSATENGLHAPVIDFDVPIEVYPSSQLGHHHLYINKEITWEQYQKILTAFVEAGLVEPGYKNAALSNGYTCVRKPGVLKPGVEPRTANVLRENALLRRENYELKTKVGALGKLKNKVQHVKEAMLT